VLESNSKLFFELQQILLGIFQKSENFEDTLNDKRKEYESLITEHVVDPRTLSDVDVNEINPLMQSDSVLFFLC
jgi:hypothetical protein